MNLPSFLTNPDPEIYRTGSYVVLDFETTILDHGSALNPDNRIVLACWRDSDGNNAYRFGGELDMGPLVAACNRADFLIAHNAKFELQWLDRCGYDIGSRPVYCTMVGEWVLAGNRRWPINLAASAERHSLGVAKDDTVASLIRSGVCPSDIPRSLLLRYCAADITVTEALYRSQLGCFDGTRLLPVLYTRCIATPVLADLEKRGLHLDSSRVESTYHDYLQKWTKVMAELDEITGGINVKSPTQVAQFVYGELGFEELCDRSGNPIRNKPTKQFPGGLPRTDEATLLSLRVTTPEQKRFLKLRKKQAKLGAALDKNLSMFVGACRENEGMIYAEVNQGTTVTHRTSSSGKRTFYKMFNAMKGCQFQNLPRIFKPLFCSRNEGWLFAEADGSQLEFRVAGYLGDDPIIKQEVRDGYDVHSFTRDVISKAGGKEITRTEAKKHTFKPLYGGQSGTNAEKAYYQAFAEKYSALVERQQDWCIEVENTKMLETEWGFRFHWPHARSETVYRWVDGKKVVGGSYLNVRTNVVNAPIQSLATADIIPIAYTYFWHRTREDQMFMVNTVHDSIEVELPPEEVDVFKEKAVQSFTEDVYFYLDKVYDMQFDVPLGVGVLIGTHWGEGEEESTQVEPKIISN